MKYAVSKDGFRQIINVTIEKDEDLDKSIQQILNEVENGKYDIYITKKNSSSQRNYSYTVFHGYYRRKNSTGGWTYKDGSKVSLEEFKRIRDGFQAMLQ